MLRISGAIQVLGELTVAADEGSGVTADAPREPLLDAPDRGAVVLGRRHAG
jgi:hypothetical protein